MLKQLEYVASYPTIKPGLRLILLRLLRKGELIHATWDEIDIRECTLDYPKSPYEGRQGPQQLPG